MRIATFSAPCVPLFSLLFFSPLVSMETSFVDLGSDAHVHEGITTALTRLAQERKNDLSEQVLKLPITQNYYRKETALNAGAIAGAGIMGSIGLKIYAPVIEDALKAVVAAGPIDRVSTLCNEHPWAYPLLAAALSMGSAAWYARQKLLKPFVLDQKTETLILTGFKQAKKTREDLQIATYEFASDREIIIDEHHELMQKSLDSCSKDLNDLALQLEPAESSEVNPYAETIAQLQKEWDIQQERLKTVTKKKKDKKVSFNLDPLENVSKILATAVGLGTFKNYGQTRSKLIEQLTPDLTKLLGFAGIGAVVACEYAKTAYQEQFHRELIHFLVNQEEQARGSAGEEIIENGLNSITQDQESNRKMAQQALTLQEPIREAFKKLKAHRKEINDPQALIDDRTHLLDAIKTILDAHLGINE